MLMIDYLQPASMHYDQFPWCCVAAAVDLLHVFIKKIHCFIKNYYAILQSALTIWFQTQIHNSKWHVLHIYWIQLPNAYSDWTTQIAHRDIAFNGIRRKCLPASINKTRTCGKYRLQHFTLPFISTILISLKSR